MGNRAKRGLVLILVIASLGVFLLIAWAVVNIGCGEIIQTKANNDMSSAFYLASAGADKMYAKLKSLTNVIWPQSLPVETLSQEGVALGTFAADAYTISSSELAIVSSGTVNGKTAKVIVRYGFLSDYTTGVPMGSLGPMSITGQSDASKVRIDGPIVSNDDIELEGRVDVSPEDSVYEEGAYATLTAPSFWVSDLPGMEGRYKYDIKGDGAYAVDTDMDGVVTLAEAEAQGKAGAFADDDVVSDNVIDEMDAFYYYYTSYLNNNPPSGVSAPLLIGEGESYYYNVDKTFKPGDIPKSVAIIFVKGNVTIDQNDQDWTGSGTLHHTIVATGDITITQPTNRQNDVLTLVSYGNVTTSGEMGNQGGTIGELVVYAGGNFTATGGGKIAGCIFAKGTITIDTVGTTGKYQRVFNKSTIDWTDAANRPLGVPPGYAIVSVNFSVKNSTDYKPIWQRE